jgi:hypothetical protein
MLLVAINTLFDGFVTAILLAVMSNTALLSNSIVGKSGKMLETICFFGCVLTTLLLFASFCSAPLPHYLLGSLSPLNRDQILILLDRDFCHYQFWQQLILA